MDGKRITNKKKHNKKTLLLYRQKKQENISETNVIYQVTVR